MGQFTIPHPTDKSRWALLRQYGRFFLLSFLPALLILTGLLQINRVAGSTEAISPPTAASTRIHLKFHDDLPPSPSALWLPLSLRNSVETMEPLFQLPQQQLTALRANGRARSGQALPNLNQWVEIELTAGSDADAILKTLQALTIVEYAELAPIPAPLPVTPDFTGNQGYLLAATNGIDAIHSWSFPGGNGEGITIFDVEYSWNQNHEDLSKASGVALLLNVGDSSNDPFSNNNHGTAVLGEMIADNDDKGVTGISWGADIGLAPANTTNRGYNPANAILLAVANGSPGDVILIEQQYWVCGAATDTSDYGPLEVLFSVFNAIQTATANGFVVVEAAGNGGMDLDDPACNGLFDRSSRDSGAIIVGAGRPPSSGLDRYREGFSSYGSRVDVQGWGSQVMTTGYGGYYKDPADINNANFWYTSTFNGTSSASPIVAGTVANLQGMAKYFGQPLSPAYVRELLVQTGSPQQGNVAQHIGPRPDLAQAIAPDLSLSQTVTPTGTVLPGQTITYTLTFTNHNVLTATNIILTDTISTYLLNAAVVSHTVTMTDTNAASGFVWLVEDLVYGTSGSVIITGQVSTTLTADIVFADTATINTPNDPFPVNNAAAPVTTTVELPQLAFAESIYEVNEGSNTAVITLTVSPTPMAAVTAALVTQDNTAIANSDYLTVSQTITVPAGSDFVTTTIPILDNFVQEPAETLTLSLADAVGAYIDLANAGLKITDNDTAGLQLGASETMTTTEAGGTATFTMSLTSEPTAAVTFTLQSTNPSEGLVSPTLLNFDAANWSIPQTITITGQDDFVVDGPLTYTVTFTPTSSTDPYYVGLTLPAYVLTNLDDDTAGLQLDASETITTSETGGAAVVAVSLMSQPTAAVTLTVSSSNPTEGIVSPTQLLFDPITWALPQDVTITGQDDEVVDGPITYTVTFTPVLSTDPIYAALSLAALTVTNIDDDKPVWYQFIPLIHHPAPVVQQTGLPHNGRWYPSQVRPH